MGTADQHLNAAARTYADDWVDARHKAMVLARGPVGLWCTSAGTADVLGVSDVRFDEDGTGLVTTRSVLFGTEDIPFSWALAGPGHLRVRFEPAASDLAEEGHDAEDDWGEIHLEFQRQRNDVGELDVLGEVGFDGFWFLVHPLRWVGCQALQNKNGPQG